MPTTPARSWGLPLFLLVALGVAVADRLTKIVIARALPRNARITIIDHLLWITHVRNRGAAFGLLNRFTWALLAVSLLVAALLIYYYRRTPADRIETRMAIALIFGGALANAYDRARSGSVIDFIEVPHWPVFNLADSAITLGVAVLILAALVRGRPRRQDGYRLRGPRTVPPRQGWP